MIPLKERSRFLPLAMVLCWGFDSAKAQVAWTANSNWIDSRITIQPILVENTAGTLHNVMPSLASFEAAADRIWAQAGIDIAFASGISISGYLAPPTSYPTSTFTDLSTGGLELNILSQRSGHSWSTSLLGGTIPDKTVRMFLVQTIDSSSSTYGYTLQSVHDRSNPEAPDISAPPYFMAIADSAFTANRLDVIAHELGHALALGASVFGDHNDGLGSGSTAPLNLMTGGGSRSSPTSLSSIFLFGTGGTMDVLTAGQIAVARDMPTITSLPSGERYLYTAIPEASHYSAIAGAGVLVLAFLRRQGSRTRKSAWSKKVA